MPSNHKPCWENDCSAVVSEKARQGFPVLMDRSLKDIVKAVFPVDSSMEKIEGDHAYPMLECFPATVDAGVLEMPDEDATQQAPDAWRDLLGAPA